MLAFWFLYTVAYVTLFFGCSYFLTNAWPKLTLRSLQPLVSIFIFFAVVWAIVCIIPDADFANRVLHAVGGGSLIVLTAFFALRTSGTRVNRFQFFVIGIAVAAVFGVANEIMEFFLQNYFGMFMAGSINDTWLDLMSNTVGSLLAIACLAPFVKK